MSTVQRSESTAGSNTQLGVSNGAINNFSGNIQMVITGVTSGGAGVAGGVAANSGAANLVAAGFLSVNVVQPNLNVSGSNFVIPLYYRLITP